MYLSKTQKVLTFFSVLTLYLLPLNAQDLVGSWSFEETSGTTAVDASGNGNDGAINGPTIDMPGKIDLAYLFGGDNLSDPKVHNNIVIPTSASLDAITSEITMMTWVKTPITGERQGLFERFLCDDPGFRSFILDINNDDGGHLNFGICADGANNDTEFILSSGGISDDVWTHVAATSNGTTMKIYINGVLDAVTGDSPDGIFAAGTDLHFGGWEFKTDAWYYPLTGSMDEAKLYNRALSAEEIAAEYQQGSLVAFWPMEETSGATTADVSGNGNDGAINGPVSAEGKIDLAFLFDGDNLSDPKVHNNIVIPTSASLDAITSEITMMTWVKTSITGERQGLFERFLCDDPGYRSFILDINNDDGGHLNFGICSDGANNDTEFILSAGGISDGEWTHVAATSDGTTMKIYINGVLDAVTGDSPDGIFAAGTDLHLGGWEFKTDAWYYPLSGTMDEAKIYDRALSADEIAVEYSEGSLVAFWPMEETSGATTADVSGNGNDGAINGPISAEGKIDLAFLFDGDNLSDPKVHNNIVIPTSASLDGITTAITMMTWVKTPVTGERQGLFERFLCDDPGYRSFIFDINNDEGHLNFGLDSKGDNDDVKFILSANTISDDVWTHVAATSDGTTMKIYINGVLDAVTGDSPDGIFAAGTDLHLGGWEFKTDAWYYPLSGVMDEAKIYDRALTAEEIADEIDKSALVGYWNFDETSGTTASDASMYANDGTLNGPVSASGKLHKAYLFDGDNLSDPKVHNNIVVPTSASLDDITSEITMITWVKTPITGERQGLFERFLCDDPGFRSFIFDINNDDGGHLNFGLCADGANNDTEFILSSGGISDDEWTHVAATSDGTTMKIYINGVLDPVTGDSPDGIFSAGKELHFGGWEFKTDAWYYPLTGIMDEAKLYSRALTAEEITADYLQTELAGAISGTVTDDITGMVLEGVTVSDGTRSGETDANGVYTIVNVPVASYTVTASTMGYRVGSEDVDVVAYEAVTADFALVDSADYIAHWPFEETADTIGMITADISVNGNDGVVYGPTSIIGKIDSAFQFNGDNLSDPKVHNHIIVPTSATLDSINSEITMITWVKTPITGERQGLFERFLCDDPGYRSFIFDINNDGGGHLNFGLDSKGDNDDVKFILSSGGISDDEWTHVAATSDGTTMKIYINGILDPVTGDSPDGIFPAGTDLHLGGWEFKTDAWYYPLTGVMDEAKIWARALSAEEISYDYAITEPTGSISGTVKDEVSGDPIEGVKVTDGTRSVDTDADGNYIIEDVPVDTVTVTASKFGYLTVSTDTVVVEEGVTTTQDFELLESLGTISGTVTDVGTSDPIEGVTVSNGTMSADTDADGNYSITGVPIGYYTVTALISGYLSSSVDSILVEANETVTADFQLIELSDLMGSWPFEETEGTTTYDVSIYHHDGVINGPVSTTGRVALGFEFDGSDDYISIPSSDWLDSIVAEITMIAWVRTTADTKQTLIERYFPAINERSFLLNLDAGKVSFALSGDGTSSDEVLLTSSEGVATESWTHVAATSDGSDMKIYLNGVVDANTAVSPSSIFGSGRDIHIGRYEFIANMWKESFNGVMDEVKIYSRALSAQEIEDDYISAGPDGISSLSFEDGQLQAYPNPFDYSTTISYKTAVAGKVTISIYNLTGQKIQSLVNETQQADNYSVVWDGTNATGGFAGSGVYFYTLNIDNKPVAMNKLVLLK